MEISPMENLLKTLLDAVEPTQDGVKALPGQFFFRNGQPIAGALREGPVPHTFEILTGGETNDGAGRTRRIIARVLFEASALLHADFMTDEPMIMPSNDGGNRIVGIR